MHMYGQYEVNGQSFTFQFTKITNGNIHFMGNIQFHKSDFILNETKVYVSKISIKLHKKCFHSNKAHQQSFNILG